LQKWLTIVELSSAMADYIEKLLQPRSAPQLTKLREPPLVIGVFDQKTKDPRLINTRVVG
jgi:hypothetical protein